MSSTRLLSRILVLSIIYVPQRSLQVISFSLQFKCVFLHDVGGKGMSVMGDGNCTVPPVTKPIRRGGPSRGRSCATLVGWRILPCWVLTLTVTATGALWLTSVHIKIRPVPAGLLFNKARNEMIARLFMYLPGRLLQMVYDCHMGLLYLHISALLTVDQDCHRCYANTCV